MPHWDKGFLWNCQFERRGCPGPDYAFFYLRFLEGCVRALRSQSFTSRTVTIAKGNTAPRVPRTARLCVLLLKIYGRVCERLKQQVSKTCRVQALVGSNPTPSVCFTSRKGQRHLLVFALGFESRSVVERAREDREAGPRDRA